MAKRIQAACLQQTIHFQLKDELPHESAVRAVKEELAHYQAQLAHKRVKYRIVEESEQPDGSIVIRIDRQYNTYSCKGYLD